MTSISPTKCISYLLFAAFENVYALEKCYVYVHLAGWARPLRAERLNAFRKLLRMVEIKYRYRDEGGKKKKKLITVPVYLNFIADCFYCSV